MKRDCNGALLSSTERCFDHHLQGLIRNIPDGLDAYSSYVYVVAIWLLTDASGYFETVEAA